MTQAPIVSVGIAIVVATLASVFDLRTRRIPNALTFGAAVAAALFHAITGGPAGLMTRRPAGDSALRCFFHSLH
jgi:Type IV leader peptidase family.